MPGMRSSDTATPPRRPSPAQLRFGIDAAPRAGGGRLHGAGLVEACAGAVAIDAAGAGIDDAPHTPAARQRAQQIARARVALALRRRRCQVQHRIGQATEPAQRGGIVQVAQQRHGAGLTQRLAPLR